MSSSDANGPTPGAQLTRPWHRDAGLLIGVWLFMMSTFVVGGAYDTDEFGLVHRILFWLLVTALVVFQPVFIERTVARIVPASRTGAWLSAVVAIIIAIPLTAIELHLLKFTPLLPRAADPWVEFIPFVGAPVIIVASFVLYLRFAWERTHLDPKTDATPSPEAGETKRGPIGPETLYVRSQDHYLEITTDTGRRFTRGRLADLGHRGEPWGFTPHRSWWVADRAIKNCYRSGRDLKLVMIDGTVVPVSRSNSDLVRSRGLI